MKTFRKLRYLSRTQIALLVTLFFVWVVVVVIRANLAPVFTFGWYFGIAVGWALTIQLGWTARGFIAAEERRRGER